MEFQKFHRHSYLPLHALLPEQEDSLCDFKRGTCALNHSKSTQSGHIRHEKFFNEEYEALIVT